MMLSHLVLLFLVGTILPGSLAKPKTTTRTTMTPTTTTTTQAGPSTEYSLGYYLNMTQTTASRCPQRGYHALAFWVSNSNAVAPLDCNHFTNNLAEPPCLMETAETIYFKTVYNGCDWADGYYNFTVTCYDAVGAMGTMNFEWTCPDPPTTTGPSTTWNPYNWGWKK